MTTGSCLVLGEQWERTRSEFERPGASPASPTYRIWQPAGNLLPCAWPPATSLLSLPAAPMFAVPPCSSSFACGLLQKRAWASFC